MVNVTRHPYSFLGDDKSGTSHLAGAGTAEGKEPTWHESLLGYCGNSEMGRKQIERSMYNLGVKVGIKLDYGVQANWQPVDSQRAMLWAARVGKQEDFVDVLSHKHFEEKKSASHRQTILDAAEEVGLDRQTLGEFLDGDELKAEVWHSYASTVHEKGIHSIPKFIFGLEDMKSIFRPQGKSESVLVNGSGDPESFAQVFESLLARSSV